MTTRIDIKVDDITVTDPSVHIGSLHLKTISVPSSDWTFTAFPGEFEGEIDFVSPNGVIFTMFEEYDCIKKGKFVGPWYDPQDGMVHPDRYIVRESKRGTHISIDEVEGDLMTEVSISCLNLPVKTVSVTYSDWIIGLIRSLSRGTFFYGADEPNSLFGILGFGSSIVKFEKYILFPGESVLGETHYLNVSKDGKVISLEGDLKVPMIPQAAAEEDDRIHAEGLSRLSVDASNPDVQT